MDKAKRQKIFEKFNGRCAYSGRSLIGEIWEVDHLNPQCDPMFSLYNDEMKRVHDPNHIDNLVPAIKIINHYKRGLSFEMWRKRMNKLNARLAKLPNNPRREKTIKTKKYLLSIASYFDITPDKPFSGKFYFEIINAQIQQ